MTEFDEDHERYLCGLKHQAWAEFNHPRVNFVDPPQAFARAAKVYEDELTRKTDHDIVMAKGAGVWLHAMTEARDTAHQMLDKHTELDADCYSLQRIIAALDSVLGPDLVREADPTGTVLKPLSHADRKALLDALDEADRRSHPKMIMIVEDEASQLLGEASSLSAEDRKSIMDRLNALTRQARKTGVFVKEDLFAPIDDERSGR